MTPDAEEARRWALEELSKQSYQDARPGLIAQLTEQFLRFLSDLLNSVSGALNLDPALVLIGGLVLLLGTAALIIRAARPRMTPDKKGGATQVFSGSPARSAQDHRHAAESAALRSDYRLAVIERFRAIARAAEERALLSPQAGRTADEVAHQLSGFFPAEAERLHWAGNLFNRLRYSVQEPEQKPSRDLAQGTGTQELLTAGQEDYRALTGLETDLLRSRPVMDSHRADSGWAPVR